MDLGNAPPNGIPPHITIATGNRRTDKQSTTNLSKCHTPGSDYGYYVLAQEASRNSKSRLSKLKLTAEEKDLLLELPSDGDGVVTKMKYILEAHERRPKRSKWQQKTGHFFLNFCKVVDKASALVQPMLPQSAEYTVTFGAVVTQNDREEALMESLDKLSAKLPVIEFYNTTFPTGEMKLVVARIYAAVMGLLDEALNYHRNSRLAKLTDAIIRPVESKIQKCIGQIAVEVKKLEDLKNVAHEAQTADIQTIVTQTGQDLSALSDDFHKVSVTLGFGMEFLHKRLLNVESTVSQIRAHEMARYTQSLHDALLSSFVERPWDADEALTRLASYDFRLSLKDHWDNNGVLVDLLAWSHDPGHDPVLWIGGSSGNQDTWVTELSVDVVQALQPQLPTVIYVFCCELAETSSALTPAALTRILVGQLLELHTELAYNDAVYYSTSRLRNATTFSGIWSIFERLVVEVSNVFIVIDRIEECVTDDDASVVDDLLPAISGLLRRTPGARAIITSISEPPDGPDGDLLESVYIDTTHRRARSQKCARLWLHQDGENTR
ncbi:hypothetical protein Daus18300_002316 [Diaporthe australafricana]|uniref:Uncharacterized protein n=1 Tax=Diaporthe australafricana TaxID=127596 RepID=A0ABR3XR07_9PEZI